MVLIDSFEKAAVFAAMTFPLKGIPEWNRTSEIPVEGWYFKRKCCYRMCNEDNTGVNLVVKEKLMTVEHLWMLEWDLWAACH